MWWTSWSRRSRSDRLFKLSTSSSVTWPPNTTFLIPSDGYNHPQNNSQSANQQITKKKNYINRRNKEFQNRILIPGEAEKQSERRRRWEKQNQQSESRTRWADPRWMCVASSPEYSSPFRVGSRTVRYHHHHHCPGKPPKWQYWPRAPERSCCVFVG